LFSFFANVYCGWKSFIYFLNIKCSIDKFTPLRFTKKYAHTHKNNNCLNNWPTTISFQCNSNCRTVWLPQNLKIAQSTNTIMNYPVVQYTYIDNIVYMCIKKNFCHSISTKFWGFFLALLLIACSWVNNKLIVNPKQFSCIPFQYLLCFCFCFVFAFFRSVAVVVVACAMYACVYTWMYMCSCSFIWLLRLLKTKTQTNVQNHWANLKRRNKKIK